ncbi:GMC oxidoreductase [Pedobacter sp. Du54]|uniref:GMC oxidoreductase n=1 Tax=Pedobacter anseongensis TaxID=3133439 RepID=UPI0030A5E8B1
MPLFDLNQLENLSPKQYDFTVIGAGAAGILLAVKLSEQGFKINIVESGHFFEDDERQSLNEIIHKSKYLNTAVWGRKRALGGTTIAWGGQSLPFSKLDFEKRDWITNSGWPITFEEVAKYYPEANRFMGIESDEYYDSMLEKIGLLKAKPVGEELIYHVSKWTKTPNLYDLYKKKLHRDVDIYYNAQLTQIEKKGDRITAIQLNNFKAKEFKLTVNTLIIAAGGIESVRILQLSSLSTSKSLGLGFMEHPCIEFGVVQNYRPYHLQRLFNTHFYKGQKQSLRLSLSEKHQKSKEILNASVSLLFEYPETGLNPYQEIKFFLKEPKVTKLSKVLKSSGYMVSTLCSYLVNDFLYKPKSIPKLNMMLEQEATSESRIFLSNELDQFGKQKAAIDWRISDLTWKTFLEGARSTEKVFKENNLGEAIIYPFLNENATNVNEYFSGVNHHMGGTKMGNKIENGVVNTDLKLWDYENAFICSSSVFPTSSHSNPTLTLLALACRLSKFLTAKNKNR